MGWWYAIAFAMDKKSALADTFCYSILEASAGISLCEYTSPDAYERARRILSARMWPRIAHPLCANKVRMLCFVRSKCVYATGSLVEPAGEQEAKLLNDVLPDAKSPKQGVRIGECTEAVRTTMRRDWGTFNSRIPLPAAFRGGEGDCSTPTEL